MQRRISVTDDLTSAAYKSCFDCAFGGPASEAHCIEQQHIDREIAHAVEWIIKEAQHDD